MNTQLMLKLEKYLKQYSVDLDYWSNDIGETHETLGSREILESHKSDMTSAMLDSLNALDAKAKALLDAYHGEETWDVKMLRQVVAIAYPKHRQVA